MFCPKCGKEMPDDAKFCPACAAPVKSRDGKAQTANGTQPASFGNSNSFGLQSKLSANSNAFNLALVAVYCILAVASLMPLFSLDVYFYFGEYSVIDLINIGNDLAAYSSSDSGSGVIYIVAFVVLAAMVVVGLGHTVWSIAQTVRHKQVNPYGIACYTVLALYCLLAVAYIQSQIKASLEDSWLSSASSALSSMVECTGWVWLILVLSIFALVAASVLKKKS